MVTAHVVDPLEWGLLGVALLAPEDVSLVQPSDLGDPLIRHVLPIAKTAHALPVFEHQTAQQIWGEGTVLDALGGHDALVSLLQETRSEDAYILVRTVRERAAGRQFVALLEAAKKPTDQPITDRITHLIKDLSQLEVTGYDPEQGRLSQAARTVREQAEKDIALAVANPDAFFGVPVHVPGLDHAIRGLQGGELIAILGATNEGKSSFLAHIAIKNALTKLPYFGDAHGRGVYYSLEVNRVKFTRRMASYLSHISYHHAVHPSCPEEDRAAYFKALRQCEKQTILKVIQGNEAKDRDVLFADMRCQVKEEGRKLIYIDYIGLVASSRRERREKRYEEIEDLTKDLKILAEELDCIIFMAGQNDIREPAKMRFGRPTLGDVAASQSIVRDPDITLLLWQPAKYLQGEDRKIWENIMVIIGGKGRSVALPYETYVQFDGATGTITPVSTDTASFLATTGREAFKKRWEQYRPS